MGETRQMDSEAFEYHKRSGTLKNPDEPRRQVISQEVLSGLQAAIGSDNLIKTQNALSALAERSAFPTRQLRLDISLSAAHLRDLDGNFVNDTTIEPKVSHLIQQIQNGVIIYFGESNHNLVGTELRVTKDAITLIIRKQGVINSGSLLN